MKKIVILLLAFAMSLALMACGGSADPAGQESTTNAETSTIISKTESETNSDETSKETGTKENPADLSQKQTIETYDGTFSCALSNTYVGDSACELLSSMGEDSFSPETVEDGRRFVILEYEVSADAGFEDSPFMLLDYIGNDLWNDDYTSKYKYYMFDLYENADKDINYAEFEVNESGTVYEVLELPEDVTEFITCFTFTANDEDYWVRCTLE